MSGIGCGADAFMNLRAELLPWAEKVLRKSFKRLLDKQERLRYSNIRV